MVALQIAFCAPYNPGMSRFVIEHLPRTRATYELAPVDYEDARAWLNQLRFASLIRTTELIAAIEAGMGVALTQSDMSMALRAGDEALLITLSFGVLLAWAQGKIPPLPEDWRLLLVTVKAPGEPAPSPMLEVKVAEEFLTGEPG